MLSPVWVAVLVAVPLGHAQVEVFATGSEWRFLDTSFEEGWNTPSHDDSAWSVGVGQFGYGDGDEVTTILFGVSEADKVITAYFRKSFNIRNPAAVGLVTLGVVRDDGVVVYLNGVEVARDNMPNGDIGPETLATSGIGGAAEAAVNQFVVQASALVSGTNVLAVEVHQNSPSSSDCTFDASLSVSVTAGNSLAAPPCSSTGSCEEIALVTAPFMQVVGPTTARVLLETASPEVVIGFIGLASSDLVSFQSSLTGTTPSTSHAFEFRGLQPNTLYKYSITPAADTAQLAGGTQVHNFRTSPSAGDAPPGRVERFMFTAGEPQATAVSGWAAFTGSTGADAVFVLGDASPPDGTSFVSGLFTPLAASIATAPVYPAVGPTEAQCLACHAATFSLPVSGEAGGVASSSEAYYSFDVGVVHVVVLNSEDAASNTQRAWLTADLSAAAAYAKWVVAVMHASPYTKGDIDSDTDAASVAVRQFLVPTLEAGGVDVVVSGAGKVFERTSLIQGAVGDSSTFTAANTVSAGTGPYIKPAAVTPNSGTVYVVAGSAGTAAAAPALNHPAMVFGTATMGTLAVDVTSTSLEASLVDVLGDVVHTFTMSKSATVGVAPSPSVAPSASPPPSATATTTVSPTVTPTVTMSPAFAVSPSSSAAPSASASPSSGPETVLRGSGCPQDGVCSCETLSCCRNSDVAIVSSCDTSQHTVAGWEMTVAAVALVGIVAAVGLYAYFKTKVDARQRTGSGLPRVKIPRQPSRPPVPNVI